MPPASSCAESGRGHYGNGRLARSRKFRGPFRVGMARSQSGSALERRALKSRSLSERIALRADPLSERISDRISRSDLTAGSALRADGKEVVIQGV